MSKTPQLFLCSCPDKISAEKIALALVEQKLAACVNIIPQMTSIYRWENKVKTAQEYLLIIKTTSELFNKLEETIKSLHSYEIPEIIGIPVLQGFQPYLNWVTQNVV